LSGITEQVAGLGPREVPANDAHQMMRRVLLATGVLSSLLYVVATDIVAAAQWDNYSRTSEMVSKLFAVGSSARPVLLVLVGGLYTVLIIAFGLGVWISANRNWALRVTGGLLIGYGVFNIVALLFPWTSIATLRCQCTSWLRPSSWFSCSLPSGSELRRFTDGCACTRSRR
jgi:Protein of unknown function (DUF998)